MTNGESLANHADEQETASIKSPLGAGGLGTVYRAQDTKLTIRGWRRA